MITLVFDQMKWLAGLFNSRKVNGFGVCRGLMTWFDATAAGQ
jgi:hypothetical protein